ncbi:carboxylesterase/lipase family protein [Sinorhizobium meliloti]|uniref:carboxylesterase/lipase family protein n=1 Tax=Rhizobium meliloti TaxID=382 RepID=UPI003F175F98
MSSLMISRRRLLQYSAAAFAAAISPLHAVAYEGEPAQEVIVKTVEGELRGARQGGLNIFKGVRYGESTAGKARFRRAQPVKAWQGVRDALKYGDPCYQINPDWRAWVDDRNGSEDCLHLNVFAPVGNGSGSKKPVMVFFHGGGYTYGSGTVPAYRGVTLAEQGDVLLVTVTHRIHLLGFLYLAGISDAYKNDTNLGILDLVEALRWVQRNIENFGGDPNNITIFGESGGGGKVSAVLGTPEAKGLFQKAIVQSGSVNHLNSAEHATQNALRALDKLGVKAEQITDIENVPVERFWEVHQELTTGENPITFAPVISSTSIPHDLSSPEAIALSAAVPMIVGTNAEESAVFIASVHEKAPQDIDAAVEAIFPSLALGNPSDKEAVHRLVTHYEKHSPEVDLSTIAFKAGTDVMFGFDAYRQVTARVSEKTAPVFHYRFDQKEPMFGGAFAGHAVELLYLFGTLDVDEAWGEAGLQRARADLYPGGEHYLVRDTIIEAWTSFAYDGHPSARLMPRWEPFTEDNQATMLISGESHQVKDVYEGEAKDILSTLHTGLLN